MMLEFLESEQINPELIQGIRAYRKAFPTPEDLTARVPVPHFHYYGKDVWEEAIAALLCGQNLLLAGPKATGKNVLAENLAAVFGRPMWNVSFHINMDATGMLGTDTFKNGEVEFRPGPVYQCAVKGGFGVFDEINMARNEAMAVLHSLLDFRHTVDIPGYDLLHAHKACRFIATMNYGYSGTRELNEALASRFAVIQLPPISMESLDRLLQDEFPRLRKEPRKAFCQIFKDLEKKCQESEISEKALDLRGMLDAIHLMETGLEAHKALDLGIVNKSFDEYEPGLIRDVINLHIPGNYTKKDIFED